MYYFTIVSYVIFIIKFQILFYILVYKNNLCKCKLDLVFENTVNFISKNPPSHRLNMALERKPKHVAAVTF